MDYFYPLELLHMGEKGGSVHRMTEEDNSVLLGLQPPFFFPCIHAHMH